MFADQKRLLLNLDWISFVFPSSGYYVKEKFFALMELRYNLFIIS
jgi:hypothetical protein